MLGTFEEVKSQLLTELRYSRNARRVFGRRFRFDRRYLVKVFNGRGNPSRDMFGVSIGHYEFAVIVHRTKSMVTNRYYDTYYCVGDYAKYGTDSFDASCWCGAIYE